MLIGRCRICGYNIFIFYNEKEVISVVELDNYKSELLTYKTPLQEVRDSL